MTKKSDRSHQGEELLITDSASLALNFREFSKDANLLCADRDFDIDSSDRPPIEFLSQRSHTRK